MTSQDMFFDRGRDWGLEEGRGFYEESDCCGSLIETLLMYGEDTPADSEGIVPLRDIPSGHVEGYYKGSNASDEILDVEVGVQTIEWKELRK